MRGEESNGRILSMSTVLRQLLTQDLEKNFKKRQHAALHTLGVTHKEEEQLHTLCRTARVFPSFAMMPCLFHTWRPRSGGSNYTMVWDAPLLPDFEFSRPLTDRFISHGKVSTRL